jgi:hypothetical protein
MNRSKEMFAVQRFRGSIPFMLVIGVWLARAFAFLCGLLCLHISMFTKDNDGKVQNWLVGIWTTVEDISERKGSRAVGLINTAAAKITSILDRIFGAQLMSARFIVTSSILSIASLYLLTALRYAIHKDVLGATKYACGVLICVLLVELSTAKPKTTVMLATGGFALLYLYWNERGPTRSFPNAIAGLTIGVFLDWFFVWSSRLILRKLGHERTFSQTVILAILITALGLILLAPAFMFVSYRLWSVPSLATIHPSYTLGYVEWIAAIASATNIVAGLCALSLSIVVMVALFHRLFWPILSQLVNVCYERRVIERRMLFFTAGSTLLTYAFGWLSWIGKLPRFLGF